MSVLMLSFTFKHLLSNINFMRLVLPTVSSQSENLSDFLDFWDALKCL